LRIKVGAFSAMKDALMTAMPAGEIEVINRYDMLPLMYLRFRSTNALKALLANPMVVSVHEGHNEKMMPEESLR
jgi:hypothetical protein